MNEIYLGKNIINKNFQNKLFIMHIMSSKMSFPEKQCKIRFKKRFLEHMKYVPKRAFQNNFCFHIFSSFFTTLSPFPFFFSAGGV